ncbi:MAG TPA: DUF4261 domain-containing protein [Thermoanaerobaculia bacterium]|nr:DUF4261 domain-containing protein [Thermoanaerobaculia bacterium]
MTTTRYAISLHYASRPALSLAVLQPALAKWDLKLMAAEHGTSGAIELHEAQRNGPRWLLEPHDEPFEIGVLRNSLEQSWNWRDAAEVIAQCRSSIRIEEQSDENGRLDLDRFRRIVAALLSGWEARAILWLPAQHFINPSEYLASVGEDDPLYGPLNIRMFHVEGGTSGPIPLHDEFIMDTIGLGPLGVADLQCHFKMLDRTRVAQVLYQTAYYLYEKGIALKSGDSVDGITEDSQWICREQEAIFPPARTVIDLDPGKEFAGAKRL